VLARVTNNVMHWSQSAQSALLHCDFDTSTSEARITQSLKRLNVEMKRMAAAVQPKSFRAAMVAMQHLADAGDRSTVLSFIQSTISPHFRGEGDRQEGFWYVNNHKEPQEHLLCVSHNPSITRARKLLLLHVWFCSSSFNGSFWFLNFLPLSFQLIFSDFLLCSFWQGFNSFLPFIIRFFTSALLLLLLLFIIIIIIIYYYYCFNPFFLSVWCTQVHGPVAAFRKSHGK
jgi:hypothetical protein